MANLVAEIHSWRVKLPNNFSRLPSMLALNKNIITTVSWIINTRAPLNWTEWFFQRIIWIKKNCKKYSALHLEFERILEIAAQYIWYSARCLRQGIFQILYWSAHLSGYARDYNTNASNNIYNGTTELAAAALRCTLFGKKFDKIDFGLNQISHALVNDQRSIDHESVT